MESVVLRGQTVLLRPLAAEDAAAVAKASPPREAFPYSFLPESGLEGARRYIEGALRHQREGRRIPFAVLWHDKFVGSTSYWDLETWTWPAGSPLHRPGRPDALEIGATWLSESAQRTRCNTEAKHLLLAHAFETWEVHRVTFRTDERNTRSRRAIERLGAVFEGVLRADRDGADGTVRNTAHYSIVRAEWPGVKMRLERHLAR